MSDHANTPDLTKPSGEDPHLSRQLSNRHIQLIAIGGAIGTGLFMGSGKTISLAGPSVIFVYMIIGFMLFFVMRAMGELLLSQPGVQVVLRLRRRPARPLGGILHRLDLLVLLDRHRHRRRHRDRRLRRHVWWPGSPLWIPALLTSRRCCC